MCIKLDVPLEKLRRAARHVLHGDVVPDGTTSAVGRRNLHWDSPPVPVASTRWASSSPRRGWCTRPTKENRNYTTPASCVPRSSTGASPLAKQGAVAHPPEPHRAPPRRSQSSLRSPIAPTHPRSSLPSGFCQLQVRGRPANTSTVCPAWGLRKNTFMEIWGVAWPRWSVGGRSR